MKTWVEWSPQWAPHVKGRYTLREVNSDGMPEEQHVEMICEKCKATWQTRCSTGIVRAHIQRFAVQHTHKEF